MSVTPQLASRASVDAVGSHLSISSRTVLICAIRSFRIFEVSLRDDERCLLVAMEPFGADDARSALRAAVGDFDRRERRRPIEIATFAPGITATPSLTAKIVGWAFGQRGAGRPMATMAFGPRKISVRLGRDQWEDFQVVRLVSRGSPRRRMISMCGSCLDSCGRSCWM